MDSITSLGHNIYQIDLVDNGVPLRSSAYLIKGEKNTLIEPGVAPSNVHILNAFQELEISTADINHILVTHIHLDHAGGAGLLMRQCENATLYVHPKGGPHLINPEKLIAGTRLVYGDLFDRYFDPILPVQAERIRGYNSGDRIPLGGGRELKILESLGHALHHVIIHDPESQGIFCGDSAGIYYRPIFERHGVKFSVPSTSPTQFDPESMKNSLRQMIDLKPKRLYYTHFGMAEPALPQLQMAQGMMSFWGEECVQLYQKEHSLEKLTGLIKNKLYSILNHLGVQGNSSALTSLDQDIYLNARGIIAYVTRLERI